MPGTAVDNPIRWIMTDGNAWRNLIQQEEFSDDEALDYMRQTREEGDEHMPNITDTNGFDYAAVQNTAADATRLTMDINNTVNAFWPRTPIETVRYDEALIERVEQLGAQVKLLSDLVGEMKEFVISMGFDKLMEGESDGIRWGKDRKMIE